MPYIKIEFTHEGVTREQKQLLIKGVTNLISEVLNPQLTHVVIQEIELDDWGMRGNRFQYFGKTLSQLKKNKRMP